MRRRRGALLLRGVWLRRGCRLVWFCESRPYVYLMSVKVGCLKQGTFVSSLESIKLRLYPSQ